MGCEGKANQESHHVTRSRCVGNSPTPKAPPLPPLPTGQRHRAPGWSRHGETAPAQAHLVHGAGQLRHSALHRVEPRQGVVPGSARHRPSATQLGQHLWHTAHFLRPLPAPLRACPCAAATALTPGEGQLLRHLQLRNAQCHLQVAAGCTAAAAAAAATTNAGGLRLQLRHLQNKLWREELLGGGGIQGAGR